MENRKRGVLQRDFTIASKIAIFYEMELRQNRVIYLSSNRLLKNVTAYANANGVESFSVGVGNYHDYMDSLQLVAGSPDRVITVTTFDDLFGIISKLTLGIQTLEGKYSTIEIKSSRLHLQVHILFCCLCVFVCALCSLKNRIIFEISKN